MYVGRRLINSAAEKYNINSLCCLLLWNHIIMKGTLTPLQSKTSSVVRIQIFFLLILVY